MKDSVEKATTLFLRFIGDKVVWSSILGLLVSALLAIFLLNTFKKTFDTIDERIGVLPWTFFPDTSMEERITLVSIDEESLAEIGPWPWSRSVMADLISKINAAGAQLQIHDVLYPAGEKPGDEEFARALLLDGKSIVAQLPIIQAQEPPIRSGVLTHSVTGSACQAEPQGGTFSTASNFLGASEMLTAVPKGHISPIIDEDGSVRKLPALICVDGKAFPALAISPLFQLSNASDWGAEVSSEDHIFGPSQFLNITSFPGLQIPLDEEGNLRISFEKSPSAFRSVPAVDIIRGDADPAVFDNALVLVGATAFGLDDIVPTPYSGFSPGVELQARVLASILDDGVPYTPAGIGYLTAALAFLLSTLLIFVAAKRGRVAFLGLPILAFVATLIGVFTHGALLSAYNLWLGWVTLGVYGFFGGWSLFLIEHARLRHERSVVMQNLTSYLPQETARKVAFQMPSSSIQADRFEVTLLSADLRNFSALGESRPPEETAAVLHYFFSKVSEIVEHNGGRVHEYKGDSVLAVWDGDGCGPAERSLRAAQAIESQINANLLSELPIEGLEPLAVGIGIEQGPALIGSIGPAHRRAHTLCGEVVTVTLRIQEMTADLAYPVLIGEVAARYLPDVELESLGHYLLPGLRKAHVLFTPLDKNQKSKEGLRLLQGGLG